MLFMLLLTGLANGGTGRVLPDNMGYGEQLSFIKSEIKAVEDDLQWLSGRIKTLQDHGRFVPQRMYDSIQFKKDKIASLKKLASRYETLQAPKAPTGKGGKTTVEAKGLEGVLKKQILTSELQDWVDLTTEGKAVRLENRLPLLFSSASAELPKGYEPFIKKLAELVKAFDVRIEVSGYADTDPIKTEKYPSNFELGAARAGAVVRAFVRHGVKPSVCKIQSTGPHRHKAGKTSEWKSLQRHADIAILFLGKQ